MLVIGAEKEQERREGGEEGRQQGRGKEGQWLRREVRWAASGVEGRRTCLTAASTSSKSSFSGPSRNCGRWHTAAVSQLEGSWKWSEHRQLRDSSLHTAAASGRHIGCVLLRQWARGGGQATPAGRGRPC